MPLTPEQLAVVEHPAGHARVTAVAGSGKTATLVERVLHLLRREVPAHRIVVLMFNVDARRQFQERLAAAAGPGVELPEVRTFHAMGYRLVRSFVGRGLLPDHRLEEAEGPLLRMAREALVAVRRENGETEAPSKAMEEEFVTFIDLVKGETEPPRRVFERHGLAPTAWLFVAAFERFEALRQAARVRFFADLLYEPVRLMREQPEVATWVANRVDHVLVDEYQDINAVQDEMVRVVAGERAEVMVVGDADQCIYEWRGARPDYLTRGFAARYPQAHSYTLSRTFRFGHRLALAADHLIRHNRRRDDTFCVANPANPDTRLHTAALGGDGPHPVVEWLRHWRAQGRQLAEAAVLVRLFSASIPVELALLGAALPYRLVGRPAVFAGAEVRALVGVLELAAGRLAGAEADYRNATVAALLRLPHPGLKAPLLETTGRRIAADPARGAAVLEAVAADLPHPLHAAKLRQRAALWQELASGACADWPPAVLLEHYLDATELREQTQRMSARREDADNTVAACEAFIEFAEHGGDTLDEFLATVDQLRAKGEPGPQEDALTITSIHRAKGLEWPLVLVADLKEGRFPRLEEADEAAIEAERRLCYVAITRAREHLVLLHPAAQGQPSADASRFLRELDLTTSDHLGALIAAGTEGSLDSGSPVARRYVEATASPIRIAVPAPSIAEPLLPGERVHHPKFGAGRVVEADMRQGRAVVEFAGHGRKTLVLAYARLERK